MIYLFITVLVLATWVVLEQIFYKKNERLRLIRYYMQCYEDRCYKFDKIYIYDTPTFDPDRYLREHMSEVKNIMGKLEANKKYASNLVKDLGKLSNIPHSRNPFIWMQEDVMFAKAKELTNKYQYLCVEWEYNYKCNYKLYSLEELRRLK